MINTVPFFFGPLGSPPQVTGQTGGVGLDQATTTGKHTNNPFVKIFRDQSVAASPLNRSSNPTSGNDEERVSNLQALLGIQPVSGDILPYLYLARVLKVEEQPVTEGGDVVETPSKSLTAGGLNGSSEVGQAESPKALIGLLSGNLSQDGSVFAGSSLSQAPSVGSALADQSAAPLVTHVDSKQVLRNAVKYLGGKPQTESVEEHGKIVVKTLNPVQDADRNVLRISPPPPLETPQGPLKPTVNQAFQAPLPFEETPAGLADSVQSSQNRLKYVSGVSSPLSESSASGKESAIGIPPDLLGEVNVSLTGDRSRDGLEATGKAVGIDPSGGQGLNTGMGGSTHSQSGFFHQSSSSPSPGSAVRMAEERVHDLPGPPLQRLQMEVQLSETNRVQIDVGVQHRQVYASLLMDHATLKNLAVQFVPQLEEQLAQGEMELQEFSAEVRDHHGKQESKTQSDRQGTQTSPRGTTSLHPATGSLSNLSIRAEGHGLHLLA